jgi:hypothetical protein
MDPHTGPRRGHLRSRSWTPVSHGLFKPALDVDGPRQDLEAWKLVLPPSGAFTHLTAAREFGWWLPPLPADLPVFAAMLHAEHRPRRSGLRVARLPHRFEVVLRDGLPFTWPAETLLGCARDLGPLDLVVLIDGALHLGWCTLEELVRLASLRRRGAPMLRRALRWADGRSESPGETLLRILHIVCDIPVEPQLVLLDEHGGFVARGDLWLTGTKTLHEYDGAEHRKKNRQRKDLARERRIGDTEWTRRGYTDIEVLNQGVAILRDADRSLGRPHRPERIRAWHALLLESMFTPSGMARARERWGLAPEMGQRLQLPGA